MVRPNGPKTILGQMKGVCAKALGDRRRITKAGTKLPDFHPFSGRNFCTRHIRQPGSRGLLRALCQLISLLTYCAIRWRERRGRRRPTNDHAPTMHGSRCSKFSAVSGLCLPNSSGGPRMERPPMCGNVRQCAAMCGNVRHVRQCGAMCRLVAGVIGGDLGNHANTPSPTGSTAPTRRTGSLGDRITK
jgi:hypothetical protein